MRRVVSFLCVLLVITAALPVWGGVAFRGTRGLIRTRSADTIGKGMLNFSLGLQYYAYKDSVLRAGEYDFGDTLSNNAIVDYHLFITRANLTYGLSNYLEVAANVDIRGWIQDPKESNGHNMSTLNKAGIGDTQVMAKLRLPIPQDHVMLGAYGEVNFPTGNKDKGFSTEENDFLILGLLTLDFTDLESFVPTRLHVNAGYSWNKNEQKGFGIFLPNYPDSNGFMPPAYPASIVGDDSYNDAFMFNAAIEFPAPQVTFFVEFDWQQFVNIPLDSIPNNSRNVLALTPGVAIPLSKGFEIKAGADINLNKAANPALTAPPDWGLWLSIGSTFAVVPQDRDGDGIPDKEDSCPDEPEDIDGFQDKDGCPDLDNDGDGIPDTEDGCPDLPEDVDGYEDGDGCPDLDNDQDGIADKDDRCPNEPEDFDGDQDEDGCPDLMKDSDNDGIGDDIDRCPLQAEDIDGFQDEDGCPDLDNDLDGIPDLQDQCPNAPETFNGFQDEDGCPDERPLEQRMVLKGVQFESGSAALTPDSYRVLDDVVRSLMAFPEIRIEISGFTDSVGKASLNLDLSQRRANSVKQYLVNAGIDPSRLVARGYGEENPLATNATPQGRSENRRIEFRRLN